MDRLASAGTQPNLEEVMDRITDAIFALDNDWRFTFVTPQAERLLQHSASDLLGRVVWDVFPEAVGTQFQIQYERALRDQVAVGFREYYQPFGTWFDVRAYPSSTGLSVFFVDVSDAVRIETELRRSEQRFRATFDRAPVGIAHVAPNGRWLRVNDRLVEILGYSRDELSEMTFTDVTYPEDLAADEAQAEALLSGEIDSYTMEKRYVRKGGRVVWVDLTVSLVRDERGEPAYFVPVVQDIEDRKRVEEQLHEVLVDRTDLAAELDDERVVLRALMANTDAHLAYLDPEFRFIAVNETYAAGSGREADELIGRNHFEVFPSEENQRIFEQARDERKAVVFRAKPFEFSDQPWRGVTYWDWRLTPVVDSDGAVQGLVLSLVNVTESVKRRRFSEALNHLNGVIHSTLDFDRIVSEVVDQLAEAMGSEIAGVALRSGDSTWRIVDVYGLPVSVGSGALLDESQFPTEPSSGLAGVPFVAGEAAGQPFTHGLLAELGVKSLLVAPLTAEEPGVIAFGYRSGPGTFDEIQIDFATKVAASLSLALNNSRLFEAETRAARMAASLASINEVLLSTLAIEDIIDRVVLESCRAVGADKSIMAEIVGSEMIFSHVTGLAKELVGQKVPLEALPAIRDAMETREPQLVSDTDVDTRASKELGRRFGYRAFIALPLVAGGHTNAVLSYTYDHPRDFDEHDREFAKRLSIALSLAFENARHFEAERTIADRLQEALLAIPDRIEGVEFAHAYYSATEAARVGGDFYDIFELNHSHVGITIGDVAGKGLDAAVLTSLVKNTIRAHATEKGKTPSDVLALTNEVLFKATGLETFVTVFFGILDCRDGRLVYSNGGHTTAVLVTEAGTTVRLPVTGPILGAFEEAGFDQAEVRLDLSELLFLYTDGLTEARRGSELYGEQRLFDFLGATRNGSPGKTAQRVIDDVVGWTGGHLRDDLAVLSLSRVEYPATTPTQQKLEL